jgi:hypothetical protein
MENLNPDFRSVDGGFGLVEHDCRKVREFRFLKLTLNFRWADSIIVDGRPFDHPFFQAA